MRFFRTAMIFGIGFALVFEGTAYAGSDYLIDTTEYSYSPSSQVATQGQTIQWDNNTATSTIHTATSDGTADGSGIAGVGALWDTSDIAPAAAGGGGSYVVAGVFPYHCTHHYALGMRGQIVIPLIAPTAATKGVSFNVQWASGDIPAGFAEDVQINVPVRRGKKRHWVPFATGQTVSQTGQSITPSRTGTYKFRARLRNTTTDVTSLYTPISYVTVF